MLDRIIDKNMKKQKENIPWKHSWKLYNLQMQSITFITGNQKKAEYLSKYLWLEVIHEKVDLDELQTLDLKEIIEHKVKQAYERAGKPMIVEDVSLEFTALGRLPGTFIKFFEKELWLERLCWLIGNNPRDAIARCIFWYYDGVQFEYFEWKILGTIAEYPRGKNGFWWDQIFIPYFSDKTSAELDELEYERFYTEEKPFAKVREFLLSK